MTMEIGALADLYYQNFAQMPEHLKKRLSMEMLREIFEKMVKPSLKSWNNPPESAPQEELLKEDDKTARRRYATELNDLKHWIREAIAMIEAEKFDLSQGASSHEILFTKCAQRDLDIIKQCCGEFL